MWKEQTATQFRCHPSICLNGLSKTTKSTSRQAVPEPKFQKKGFGKG
jgi:hypothetical protein